MKAPRHISSLDTTEPAVRYRIGWQKAFYMDGSVDCDWDEHSNAGYEAGKKAHAALDRSITKLYGTSFHKVTVA